MSTQTDHQTGNTNTNTNTNSKETTMKTNSKGTTNPQNPATTNDQGATMNTNAAAATAVTPTTITSPQPTTVGTSLAAPAAPTTPAAIAAYVAQAIASLDAFEAQLGADPPLTPAMKRHSAKYRKGGSRVVAQVANLAVQNQLESPTMQASAMTDSLAAAQALMPLVNRLAQFGQHVSDLVFTAESSAWTTTLAFYALLKHRARTDTTLKAALQPIAAEFTYRNPATQKASTLTKPQQRATAKAVKTLKHTAPSLLAAAHSPGAPAPGSQVPVTPSATPTATMTAAH